MQFAYDHGWLCPKNGNYASTRLLRHNCDRVLMFSDLFPIILSLIILITNVEVVRSRRLCYNSDYSVTEPLNNLNVTDHFHFFFSSRKKWSKSCEHKSWRASWGLVAFIITPLKKCKKQNKFTVDSDNQNFQGACQKQPRSKVIVKLSYSFKTIHFS